MEAPELFHGGLCRAGTPQFTPEKRFSEQKPGDHFVIDDLLDFSNDDELPPADESFGGGGGAACGNSTDSSTVVDSSNSSFSGDLGPFLDSHFSGDLCVPYDDMAELEWLSNFVEESFSSEDLEKPQLISGLKVQADEELSESREFSGENSRSNPVFHPEVSVPGKARSKRSRSAPGNWSSRLLVMSLTTSSSEPPAPSSVVAKKTTKPKNEGPDLASAGGEGRKCLHCATDKTPQWRTGPMGPKTLCNACGVRYKSGRLVPEYRPAASPTFVLTKHSNSHRKVLELRRQKEMQRAQQMQPQFLHPNHVFDIAAAAAGEDFLIHHAGPDFLQLI